MKKKILYILAPNDRFNYGDLIFSHILKHYFEKYVDKIFFCSTTKSDLSKLGSIPTENYRLLYKAKPENDNYLIVAGGDSLGIGWPMIISFLDKNINYLNAVLYKLFPHRTALKIINMYIKFRYHTRTRFPFSIGKNELKNFNKVFYNSLGGSCLTEELLIQDEVVKIFKSVDYISVRDNQTKQILEKYGINSTISADSAILMSKVFDSKTLKGRISKKNSSLQNTKYVFFQINIRYAHDNEQNYANLLTKISMEYDVMICLCPIGTAPGHEDNVALKEIAKYMDPHIYILIEEPNIWDIMWLIKSSCLYIGTSLHGTITSISYEVPFVAHGPAKLKNYILTWGEEKGSLVFAEENKLYELITKQLENPIIIDNKKQFDNIQQSLKHMLDNIMV